MLSVRPCTIGQVRDTIEQWSGKSYKGDSPFTFNSRHSGIDVLIPHNSGLKVEIHERSVLFQIRRTKLNLNLDRFLLRSAWRDDGLRLRIERDPEPEYRLLVSVLEQFRNTTHPAFCARMLRAVRDLEHDLTGALIDEATAAPTDKLVMFEAVSSSPWLAELADQDPVAASRFRGFELRREMVGQAGGVLSSERVAQLLNLSRQAVDKRRAANQLLALTQGRRGYGYPGFQFEHGNTLTGLEEVLRGLSDVDPWMQLLFFTRPHERLGNLTPIEALRRGQVDEVFRAASGYGAARRRTTAA